VDQDEKAGLDQNRFGEAPKSFWKMLRPKDLQALVLRALLEEREAEWKA